MKIYKRLFESRIISTKEKALDKNGRTIRPGDYVYHPRFGKGQIVRIDLKTYSIPMIVFDSSKGEIFRSADEFSLFK